MFSGAQVHIYSNADVFTRRNPAVLYRFGGKTTDTSFTISKSLESKSKSHKLRTYRQDPGLTVAVIDLRSSIIALGAVLE